MPPQFRMYVDESGDNNLHPYPNDASKLLCLTGVIINLNDIEDIKYQMDAIKYIHFDIDVFNSNYPLHRKELINCTPPFDCLSDSFNRNFFNEALLFFLQEWPFHIISVLINKEQLESKYTRPYPPYRYGFAILMEKFSVFLLNHGSQGDIMCESIGKKEDKQLKYTYTSLFNNDFQRFSSEQFRRTLSSGDLKLKKKDKCITGLEIADLIAAPMKRYIIRNRTGLVFEREIFDDKIIEVIEPKIYHRNGCRNGYGIKLFP